VETPTQVSTPVNTVPLSLLVVPSPVETIQHVSTGVPNREPLLTPVGTSNVPSIHAGDAVLSTPVDTMAVVSTPVDTGQVVSSPLQRFLADRPLFISSVGKRLFRPKRPSDAHTDGEDRLYKVMWAGSTRSDSNVRIYSASVAALARAMGREERNTRPLIESLIRKLSIAIAREQDYRTRQARVYYVYDDSQIAVRRQQAGLEWALKNKGIQLLAAEDALILLQSISTA
jgi:hypothetical protein